MIQLCSLGSRYPVRSLRVLPLVPAPNAAPGPLSVAGPPALVRAMVGPALSGRFTPGRGMPHKRLTRESARRSPPWRARQPEARESVTRKAPGHTITLTDLGSGSDGTPGTQFATNWAQTNSTPGRRRQPATELLKSAGSAGSPTPIHRLSSVRYPPAPMCRQAQEASSFHRRYLQVIIRGSWRNIESPRSVALTG
jgi:hypothetical protein